jgi:hypothetical protein
MRRYLAVESSIGAAVIGHSFTSGLRSVVLQQRWTVARADGPSVAVRSSSCERLADRFGEGRIRLRRAREGSTQLAVRLVGRIHLPPSLSVYASPILQMVIQPL